MLRVLHPHPRQGRCCCVTGWQLSRPPGPMLEVWYRRWQPFRFATSRSERSWRPNRPSQPTGFGSQTIGRESASCWLPTAYTAVSVIPLLQHHRILQRGLRRRAVTCLSIPADYGEQADRDATSWKGGRLLRCCGATVLPAGPLSTPPLP